MVTETAPDEDPGLSTRDVKLVVGGGAAASVVTGGAITGTPLILRAVQPHAPKLIGGLIGWVLAAGRRREEKADGDGEERQIQSIQTIGRAIKDDLRNQMESDHRSQIAALSNSVQGHHQTIAQMGQAQILLVKEATLQAQQTLQETLDRHRALVEGLELQQHLKKQQVTQEKLLIYLERFNVPLA